MLVVAKPVGPTSHDVVALVRRLSGTRRVGHGGTLDPFASGVLPLFLGRATRLVEYHLSDTKAYRATVCFGASSSTDDLEGELVPVEGPRVDRAAVEAALDGFRGEIEQRPPAYSAVKVAGRRAYARARAGESVELAARRVRIDRLELVEWDESDPVRPVAVLEIACSAGTYVRSVARDLGAALGSGAYLGALSRTASGSFRLDEAIPLEEVRATSASGGAALASLLRPIDAGLDDLPEVTVAPEEIVAVARGQFVRLPADLADADDRPIRVRAADGRLVAIAVRRGDRLMPDKVLVDPAPAANPGVGGREGASAAASTSSVPASSASEADPPLDIDPDPTSPDDA